MQEVAGDFWNLVATGEYDTIVCTTNNCIKRDGGLVMGAGIAKQFADRCPELQRIWAKHVAYNNVHEYGNRLLVTPCLCEDWVAHGVRYVIGFPTKYDWRQPSSRTLIANSMKDLVTVVDCLGLCNVLMTRPGTNNGQLSWRGDVRPIVMEQVRWDSRFTLVDWS